AVSGCRRRGLGGDFTGGTTLPAVVRAGPGVGARGASGRRRAPRAAPAAAPVVVSIRPHEIELVTAGRAVPAEANVLPGTVQRTSYLGDTVDYQVQLSGTDVVLRVTAAPPAPAAA